MMLKKIQKIIDDKGIKEFSFMEYSFFDKLILIGSGDISYYHQIEIIFHNVSYISCPTMFRVAKIRKATSREQEAIRRLLVNDCDFEKDIIFCIETDIDDEEIHQKHYIVAEKIEYNNDFVYHYKRENLKENERIAEWVRD